LAELGKTDVSALAQLQSGGDHQAVNIHTSLALELEQHVHRAGVICAAAENPAATAQNCACEGLNQPRRLFDGDGLHLHRPGKAKRLRFVVARYCSHHTCLIGVTQRSLTIVPESNGI